MNADLAAKWTHIRDLRRVVTGTLELERAAKRIGSSLQAHPIIHADDTYRQALEGFSEAEIAGLFITSGVTFANGPAPEDAFRMGDIPGIAVVPGQAEGEKCARCWKVLADVGAEPNHPDICGRCADAVDLAPVAAD